MSELRLLTTEERLKVIEDAKLWIEHDGVCVVSIAMKRVGINKEELYLQEPFFIAAFMCRTGEYKYKVDRYSKENFEYFIFPNPEYKPPSWKDKNPVLWEFIKAGITAGFAIVVSYLIGESQTKQVSRQQSNPYNEQEIAAKTRDTFVRHDTIYLLDSSIKKLNQRK